MTIEILQHIHFTQKGEVDRDIKINDYQIDGVWLAHEVEVTDNKTQRKTIGTLKEVQINQPIPPETFTLQFLENPNFGAAMFTVLLSILACTSDKGDSGLSDPSTFEGGSNLTSIAVNDQCLDGAFDVLFLPDETVRLAIPHQIAKLG